MRLSTLQRLHPPGDPGLAVTTALAAGFSAGTPGQGSRHDGNVLLLVVVVSIALVLVVAGVVALYYWNQRSRETTRTTQGRTNRA